MKNNKIILIVALLLLCFQSCNSWLDVQPNDKFTEKQVFSTRAGFYTAVNGIYTTMNSKNQYGAALSFEMIEIMAKRYNVRTDNQMYSNIAGYAYTDTNVASYLSNVWEGMFKNILTCNIILKNIDLQKELLGEKEAAILKGEMLAARAFMHFDLLRLFGPIYAINKDKTSIPYNLSVGDVISPLHTAEEVINNYILKDIIEAEALLKKFDPIITEGRMSSKTDEELKAGIDDTYRYRQLRLNYYAVLLLKARVELYKGDKEAALATAKMLIKDSDVANYFPFVDPNSIIGSTLNPDRMFSTECLFGLYDNTRGDKLKNYFDPASSSSSLLQPRTGFVNAQLFSPTSEVGDYRKQSQWGISTSPTNSEPILIKHLKIANDGLFFATFTPLMRLSEAYLIAAESEPVLADGLKHLNEIRLKRGVMELNITAQAAFDSAILMEYSREFFGEGQMFFYYKRRNINIPSTNNGQAASTIGFANNSVRAVPTIPESETSPR